MILLDWQTNFRAPNHGETRACRSLISMIVGVIVITVLAHAAMAQDSTTDVPTAAGPSSSTRLVIWCYDATRDVVYRELASDCRGSVVSDADAKKIQERRVREVTKALARPEPPLPGGRLASIGTAFFVDDDGHLITNYHVVDGCKVMIVDRPTGKSLPASVSATDEYHDLALLHVDLADLHLAIRSPTIARFRSQDLTEPGAFVAAIGYPDEGLAPRQPVITTGEVMALPAGEAWGEHLAIKGDIRHGNSGSPIVDRYGLVVGIVDAKIDPVKTYRETGVLPPDIGIGVSLPIVLRFLQANLVHYQYGNNGPELTPAEILSSARSYIARANCWK